MVNPINQTRSVLAQNNQHSAGFNMWGATNNFFALDNVLFPAAHKDQMVAKAAQAKATVAQANATKQF